MTRRLAASCALAVVTSLVVSAQEAQRPVYQASSDLVAIDVAVVSSGHSVTGLTAADFTIADNGKPQRVERVDAAAMPLDVTLILDVSGFTGGAWTNNVPPARVLSEAAAKAHEMAGVLRPDDRLQVIVSDTYNRRMSPWTEAHVLATPDGNAAIAEFMSTTTAQGLSSVYDALAAALMRSVPYGRRHAVVAWTKARDTVSATDAAALRTIASRSDAALHVVLRDTGTNKSGAIPGRSVGADRPVSLGSLESQVSRPGTEEFSTQEFAHSWQPFRRHDPAVLRDAAILTGGTFHDTGVLRDRDVVAEFRDVFDIYRQGYVLRYAPTDVTREGWHDVVVRVPKLPGASIRGRHGYAIESTSVPAPTSAISAPSGMSALDDLVAAFDRGDDSGLEARLRQMRDLRRFIRDYRAVANPWPGSGRQEALFVLHVGFVGLLSGDAETRADAVDLLDHYRELVRSPFALQQTHGMAAEVFECRWYGAAFAVFEGALTPSPVLGMADAAIGRCPEDGGLRLARAIATDQRESTRTLLFAGERPTPRPSLEDVLERYAEAAAFPAVADEARVRAAWAAYRHQQLDAAMDLVSGVSAAPADPVVNYFSHFVRAQVVRRLGDNERAAVEYQAAIDVRPAQGPRVALMTLLTQLGRRAEAERLAEAVATAPADSVDPWWVYWLGDYRSFGARLAELRALAEQP